MLPAGRGGGGLALPPSKKENKVPGGLKPAASRKNSAGSKSAADRDGRGSAGSAEGSSGSQQIALKNRYAPLSQQTVPGASAAVLSQKKKRTGDDASLSPPSSVEPRRRKQEIKVHAAGASSDEEEEIEVDAPESTAVPDTRDISNDHVYDSTPHRTTPISDSANSIKSTDDVFQPPIVGSLNFDVTKALDSCVSQLKAKISDFPAEHIESAGKCVDLFGTFLGQFGPVVNGALEVAVNSQVAPIAAKVGEQGRELKKVKATCAELKSDIAACTNSVSFNSKLVTITSLNNELEAQQSRANTLKVYGCPMDPSETNATGGGDATYKVFSNILGKIGVQMDSNFISDCYRTRSRSGEDSKPPPIVITFLRSRDRQVVLRNKSKLNQLGGYWKNIRIEDSLTTARSIVLRKLIGQENIDYVCSRNGRIVVRMKTAEGERQNIVNVGRLDDVQKIGLGQEIVSSILEEALGMKDDTGSD